jgi:hypothetical protein
MNKRPTDVAYQFQCKISVKGYLRIRGLILYAEIREKALYDGLVCGVSTLPAPSKIKFPVAVTPP